MKLNTKDLISAALLIGFALVGLWLNMDHNMGTARRMGPGYMPFLGFVILLGLGVIVLLLGLFNGPDPLAKWTSQEVVFLIGGAVVGTAAGLIAMRVGGWPSAGWNALGIGMFVGCLVPAVIKSWRPLFLVSAAFALFGLVLEPLGLMLAITLCVVLAAFADETHKPLGVVGLVVFLCVLCWAVFIYELDIRVPVWPQF
ncbi:tripartite tricarboxylate transporter TctB family protein [Roseomonas fluvialis]|uniref:Tripartite tricarboxylate transporter TctB n=1 Tax=Roseomonas fluvialis TaxID=1750527 RepID=A0ABM7Y0V8_9PROT|nr:tripartite tricarboxylate transporter TctB family protein [Roseomonas fluvialis]BDG71432.1 tripartite tricarboxylate transporter TctB [Roseomonas fluvialis]